jgi:hypothetical protein
VLLDTPYGFQENAPELAQRGVEYFRASVGKPIEVAGLQRIIGGDPTELERGFAAVRRADVVFAGPGSPTYALRQWKGTPVPGLLIDKLQTGGAVTFASAAALTLGCVTVPVYEIYKAGDEPFWLEGLDVLAAVGINAAVIPHYDNAEGGHHDTRFCYLGERRLALLERELPPGAHVIGVDEHTGVVIDLDAGTATVVGNGRLTIRVQGVSEVHAAGAVLPLAELRDPGSAAVIVPVSPVPADDPIGEAAAAATSLKAEAEACETEFGRALADGDGASAAAAALRLEQAITAWSADTLQSDEADQAHSILRSMIVRLGDTAAEGLVPERERIEPVMQILLEIRARVRGEKRFDLSDVIRDLLTERGIEVRDTPEGAVWDLRP